MIRGIHHTAISTGDIERSIAFYEGLFGFEVVMRFDWDTDSTWADAVTGLRGSSARVAMLKHGNAFIEIFQYASPQPKVSEPNRPVCDHGITHIAMLVDDVDAEYERLKAAGMEFHCAPPDGLRATYGRDPDGNVVEIMQVAAGGPLDLEV